MVNTKQKSKELINTADIGIQQPFGIESLISMITSQVISEIGRQAQDQQVQDYMTTEEELAKLDSLALGAYGINLTSAVGTSGKPPAPNKILNKKKSNSYLE